VCENNLGFIFFLDLRMQAFLQRTAALRELF